MSEIHLTQRGHDPSVERADVYVGLGVTWFHCLHKTDDVVRTPGGFRERCCYCGKTQDRTVTHVKDPPRGHGQHHPQAMTITRPSVDFLGAQLCEHRAAVENRKRVDLEKPG